MLNHGRQDLLVLVHIRQGETFAQVAAGFGVPVATAWWYVREVVKLLPATTPKLAAELRKPPKAGLPHLILDGTLIRTDRVRADRPYFSMKHRTHGMNIQVMAGPYGAVIATSGSLLGKTHGLSAARLWGIPRHLEAAGILTLADRAYQGIGTDPVITPYKGRNKPEGQKRANRSHARLPRPGERANAQPKSWRSLRRSRCSPSKAGHLVKAIEVLHNHRVARG